MLTNEVQDGKDQAWPPRRDWLTNARSLKEVKVWPCGCLKGECSRNSKEDTVSAAEPNGREWQADEIQALGAWGASPLAEPYRVCEDLGFLLCMIWGSLASAQLNDVIAPTF